MLPAHEMELHESNCFPVITIKSSSPCDLTCLDRCEKFIQLEVLNSSLKAIVVAPRGDFSSVSVLPTLFSCSNVLLKASKLLKFNREASVGYRICGTHSVRFPPKICETQNTLSNFVHMHQLLLLIKCIIR